ncbi:glycosyl transferase family 2 [candidate division TA06 bacterium SM1_40]|uniref:Glycosyl transferase family 2 n=3 Tax=Bacteria division TA06 TaxID=1156500 RepID=A0A0S8JLI3_UNCT6|nr:MAG: glycosyl transferase family 2 [candidate division TA06 bacterium SM23_40]KPL10596.1 MAG: glycosyl transferase family 2 [candidate division TA06 bacterium SM1_40]
MERLGRENSSSRKHVVVIMPAYNAERTLRRTYRDIPKDAVDEIILVDDASQDRTLEVARELGLVVYAHERNRGYGANQKTCYARALERGADVVVMVHPDHQYDPKVIPDLLEPLLRDECDAVFGSRMLGGRPLDGRMPTWKYLGNVFLSAIENAVFLVYLTEYHSGFRAFSRRYLEAVRFDLNSDGFVFDTEIIAQGIANGMKIREIAIETRYFEEASSIGFNRSVLYGLRILKTLAKFILHRNNIWRFGQFEPARGECRR